MTPSDSVAIIAMYAQDVIPFFLKKKDGKGGIRGLARSMPTSSALDSVAKSLGKWRTTNPRIRVFQWFPAVCWREEHLLPLSVLSLKCSIIFYLMLFKCILYAPRGSDI